MSEGAASSPVTIEELLEHGRWVRRLATSLVVGEEAAEELAQASMVQAISHPPRHRGNLRAWLATITRNVARDRGRERDREKDPRWLEAVRREHGLDSGDQIVARIETQRLVSEVLLGLEPQLRDVLVLRFYDELSYREIGERLDLPAETARSRTARGLEELRRRLDQKGGESAVEWRTGLVLWIGSAEWTRLAGGSGAAVGGGLVGWAPGLSALQLFAVLLLSGLLALFAWAPWGKESLPDTLALGPNSGAPQDSSVAAAGPATETAADRTTAGSDTRAELGDWVGVSGRVLEHAGRAPVAGARVLLTEGCRRGRAKRIETETDAEGRFRFDGRLEEFELGPERLLASFEGDFVLRIETDVELASFEDTFSRATMTGDLSGQSALDADLGDLTLTHAVPLRVSLDGDWAPSGSLWMGELSPGEHPPRRFRQVGDWGASREPRLWDLFGAYVHRDASRVLIALDGAGGFAYVDVDLPLDAARPRALHLERSPPGRVEVQLLDGEDRPVQNVPVVATPLFWPLRSPGTRDFCYHARLPRPTGFDASRRSVTNEDGVAVFESLPSGTAVDAAEDAGRDGLHPAGTYVFCAGDYGSAPRPHRLHAPSVVRAGDVNRLTLRYDESRRVDIEGRVTDEDGKPLSGIPVAAVDHLYTSLMSGNQGSPIEVRDFTDSEGRYRLLDVDRQAQGVEIVSVDGVDVGRAHALYEIGVPDAGVRRFDVVLPLAKDLRGWLVDAQGQPVHRPGLTVYARPAKLDPLREHPAPDFRMAVEADGSFGTRALPEGRWVLYPFEFEARGLVPFEPFEFQLGEVRSR
ncbi:MAG: sigma-70 family RNA polymerase sigma factor [Planctomycetes bacterium]|nr:sigma-70 family RNA polymerase sigma factor [Planctomycetota bacterium]